MTTPHPHSLPAPRLEQVSDGIYAYVQLDGSWFLNNCGFLVAGDGVVVIDTTSTAARARAFATALRETTDKPVRTLVNTHYHADHTNGNFLFADATIVGHQRCRDEMLALGDPARLKGNFTGLDFGDIVVTLPSLTFPDRLKLHAGDLEVELIHVGTPAHTTGDVVVWLPQRRLLFTGDLVFNGGTPLAIGGSIAGWLEALDLMRGLGAERLVPGHGSLCGPEAFDAIESYLRFVQAAAKEMAAKRLTPLEYARGLDLGDFTGLTDPERIVANLRRAESELRREPRGTSLSLLTSIQEMVAFNGGQPLRCYA